jgi:predicted ribosomally synthesized peptide with SipW-like signal peptide
MKKKALPVGTMFLVLVIALAAIGVGYALWSETLTIQGTVQTGEVDVEFSQYPVEECIDIQGVLTCPEPPEKADAANCTVAWSNTSTDPNDNGANLLQITVTGMYPSYHCKVGFDVTSTGNVPVHVWLPEPAGDIPDWVATNFEDCYPNGVQLHQGESTGKCTVDIHFTNDQAPPENSGPITFGWTILATQFNEDPVAPPDIITVQSAVFNFSSTGWAGWSCPVDHPYVVSADTSNCTLPLANSLAWKPGASVGSSTYPTTPFGYTYPAGEEGWIVQNGGTGQSCYIEVDCSDTAP